MRGSTQLTKAQIAQRKRQEALERAHDSGKKSYFDASVGGHIHRVLPGECVIVSDPDEYLATVLGSCVSACIRDPMTGMGGMNHYMLPEADRDDERNRLKLMCYGNHAMRALIADLLEAGCRLERLQIKLFGGANVIVSSGRVGHENAAFARRFIAEHGLRLDTEDLGGQFPRRILYHPRTGQVDRLFLKRATDKRLLPQQQFFYER